MSRDDSARPAPAVSIVIPAYNRAEFLASTLESVRNQSFVSWEAIVADDGSTDETVAVAVGFAQRDERFKVHPAPHAGVAVTRNRGFAHADPRSDFVIFLDSDDRWESNALASLLAVLERERECVSAYGQLHCMDEVGELILDDDMAAKMRSRRALHGGRLVPVPAEAPLTFSALAVRNWVTTPGLHLIRRSIAERAGGFDPSTDPADDWDYVIRISRLGPIAFLDQVVLRWRRHGGALTNTSPRWRGAYYSVRRKMLVDPSNTAEQRRIARAAYRWTAREAVGQAAEAVRQRRLSPAAHHLARAAHGSLQLLQTEIVMQHGRRRARHQEA